MCTNDRCIEGPLADSTEQHIGSRARNPEYYRAVPR